MVKQTVNIHAKERGSNYMLQNLHVSLQEITLAKVSYGNLVRKVLLVSSPYNINIEHPERVTIYGMYNCNN